MPWPWESAASPLRGEAFWHAEAERERAARAIAEERAEMWADRYARLIDRLVASATAAKTPPAGPTSPTEAPAEPAAPDVPPPEVVAAVDRMAGRDAAIRKHLNKWVREPAQRALWAEPRDRAKLVDLICRGIHR